MVRGPAAVLAAFAAALLYLALAPSLPAPGGRESTAIVSGTFALLALAACALTLLPARREPVALALLALGGGLLAGGLTAAAAGAPATLAKVLFASALGMLLARWLDHPALLIAIPPFVALIDVASVLGGPASELIRRQPPVTDFLSFSLPQWGGHGGGQLGLSDIVFLAFFASAALRHGFRREATIAGLLLGLVAALVVGVLSGRALPVLPALALGLLAPNLDRIGRLLRATPA